MSVLDAQSRPEWRQAYRSKLRRAVASQRFDPATAHIVRWNEYVHDIALIVGDVCQQEDCRNCSAPPRRIRTVMPSVFGNSFHLRRKHKTSSWHAYSRAHWQNAVMPSKDTLKVSSKRPACQHDETLGRHGDWPTLPSDLLGQDGQCNCTCKGEQESIVGAVQGTNFVGSTAVTVAAVDRLSSASVSKSSASAFIKAKK